MTWKFVNILWHTLTDFHGWNLTNAGPTSTKEYLHADYKQTQFEAGSNWGRVRSATSFR